MSPTRDPFQSSLAFLTRLKYGGPVGKITALAVTFFIVLGGLIPAARNMPLLLVAILLAAFGGLVFAILRIEAIFKTNPDMATLEGKEILEFRRLEVKSRGGPPTPVDTSRTDPTLPPPRPFLLPREERIERKDD